MSDYQHRLFQAIWNGDDGTFDQHGIEIYRTNLNINAERALSITYPTLVQLVGEEYFSLLSRAFIQHEKLETGDWGLWGKSFPDWLATNDNLTTFPFIADCAKLDWFCHIAERDLADIPQPISELNPDKDLGRLSISYCAGAQLLHSAYPVVNIWLAHHSKTDEDCQHWLNQAKQKLSEGVGQTALVWRPHWQAQVREVTDVESDWLSLTFNGHALSDALDKMSTQFSFKDWLQQSISDGLVKGLF